jgi:hypothetical protein
MMMTTIMSHRSNTLLNTVNQGNVIVSKPWLKANVIPIVTSPTDTAQQRWLLPYADFLTVLFCITLLWCGLALKQAYWLQIQNTKLEQALQQASQQVVETTQALERQSALLAKLKAGKPAVLGTSPSKEQSRLLLPFIPHPSVEKAGLTVKSAANSRLLRE